MITRHRFYQVALATPIVVPLLAFAAVAVFGETFFGPALIFGFSWLYTRWTYPVFALLTIAWMRRRSIAEIERGSVWLPLLYAPLCGVEMASLYARPVFSALWNSDFLFGTLVAVPFGYAYVGLVRLGAELLTASTPPVAPLRRATSRARGT